MTIAVQIGNIRCTAIVFCIGYIVIAFVMLNGVRIVCVCVLLCLLALEICEAVLYTGEWLL